MESVVDQHKYSHPAYDSSVEIMRSDTSTRSHCWYAHATSLLGSIGIEIDRLPPYQFSLDALAHLLPSRQELNEHVRQDIYRQYITTTCSNPPGGLRPKMAFYAKHFLEIQDGIIVRLAYLYQCWNHVLWFSLSSFKVGSHSLRAQIDHHMDRAAQICQLCTMAEVEIEIHFIF